MNHEGMPSEQDPVLHLSKLTLRLGTLQPALTERQCSAAAHVHSVSIYLPHVTNTELSYLQAHSKSIPNLAGIEVHLSQAYHTAGAPEPLKFK